MELVQAPGVDLELSLQFQKILCIHMLSDLNFHVIIMMQNMKL
jgi:hypothetical protein